MWQSSSKSIIDLPGRNLPKIKYVFPQPEVDSLTSVWENNIFILTLLKGLVWYLFACCGYFCHNTASVTHCGVIRKMAASQGHRMTPPLPETTLINDDGFHREKSATHPRLTRCQSPDWWCHSSARVLARGQPGVSAATARPHHPSVNKQSDPSKHG